MLPAALNDVIDALGRLPGVGSRTAERYAYFLLKSDANISDNIASALSALHTGVKTCPKTFAIMDASEEVSPLYDDPTRDKSLVLVVEEPLDIYAIERTKSFTGTFTSSYPMNDTTMFLAPAGTLSRTKLPSRSVVVPTFW